MSDPSLYPAWARAFVGMIAIGVMVFMVVWSVYGLIALVRYIL
jgi:hypothetical protein